VDGAGRKSEGRFAAYVDSLAGVLGHRDRTGPLMDYCTGLLMPGERKSVEPIASIVAPSRVAAAHQSLLHFVGQSAWSDGAMLAKVRELAAPAFEAQGGVEAWIVDDTGFQKKGSHSVGVARQYCGRLGKTDNCQIAVTLSIANHHVSLPIAYRLYLPEDWAKDAKRRKKAHVPEAVEFRTKPQIALAQIDAAVKAGVAPGIVLADAGYGSDGAFRAGVTALGLTYAAGVQSTLSVWPPGEEPLPPKPWSGRGRKPSRLRHDGEHRPVPAKELVTRLPAEAWSEVEWREGSNEPLSSRFAAVPVRPASRDHKLIEPHPVEWLVVEWPEGEAEPTKYWLSTLPEDASLAVLVDVIKLRWRIERDYEELKSELGLAHFEGRGWRGFHHHASLCIATYGFLILERSAFPPSARWRREKPSLSGRSRSSRATDTSRTPRRQLDRDDAKAIDDRPGEIALSMPVLSNRLTQAKLQPKPCDTVELGACPNNRIFQASIPLIVHVIAS
jgi:SRSO17 transposase